MNTSAHGRTALAASALTVAALCAAPADAHEPPEHSGAQSIPAYATPLGALGGLTLSQYIATHVQRVLAPARG